MTQYCRYCCNAYLHDGWFYCDAKKECYAEEKAKRVNKCKNFDFNENDLLGMKEDGTFRTYKPREKSESKQIRMEMKQ